MEDTLTLAWHGLTQLKELIDRGELSSLELTESLLDRIARADGKLHAFVEVYADEARALARAADQARAAHLPRSPLHGLPVVLKDLLDIEGRIGTLGSKHYVNRVAAETSATVERLLAAGMVPLGKVHMTEFAFGGWGTNPLMGTPHNPWDLDVHRVPGGSSSGTAVAVAAGLAPVGIGSDTGGSVRIPSAFNGLTGLKVTFGRISLHATGLLSWTLDSIGPLGRCVRDCALVLDALAAPDPRDPDHVVAAARAVRTPAAGGAWPAAGAAGFAAAAGVHGSGGHGGLAVCCARIRIARGPGGRHAAAIVVFRPVGADRLHHRFGSVCPASRLRERRVCAAGPGGAQSHPCGEKFGPGDYAQTLRTMAQRRREFSGWFEDYDAVLLPTIAIPAIALAAGRRGLADPGLPDAPGQLPRAMCAVGAGWAGRRAAHRRADHRQAVGRAHGTCTGPSVRGGNAVPRAAPEALVAGPRVMPSAVRMAYAAVQWVDCKGS